VGVGCERFMVKWWARAAGAGRLAAAIAMRAPARRALIACILSFPPSIRSRSASGQQVANPDQREVRYVRDQRQGHEVNYHERDDAAIDRLELEAEHGLRHENVDPERRMKQADREGHRYHDPEMEGVDP